MRVYIISMKVCAGLLVTGLLATEAAAKSPGYPGSSALVSATASVLSTNAVEPTQEQAQAIAEQALKAGSELFRSRNAEALANTYTENGEIHLISRRNGELNVEVRKGRNAVLDFYEEIFEHEGTIDATNTVESARLIGSDLLVINGRFRPEAGKGEFPFVQLRTKQGEDWKLQTLWFFISPEE